MDVNYLSLWTKTSSRLERIGKYTNYKWPGNVSVFRQRRVKATLKETIKGLVDANFAAISDKDGFLHHVESYTTVITQPDNSAHSVIYVAAFVTNKKTPHVHIPVSSILQAILQEYVDLNSNRTAAEIKAFLKASSRKLLEPESNSKQQTVELFAPRGERAPPSTEPARNNLEMKQLEGKQPERKQPERREPVVLEQQAGNREQNRREDAAAVTIITRLCSCCRRKL